MNKGIFRLCSAFFLNAFPCFFLIFCFISTPPSSAQTRSTSSPQNIPGKHRGAIATLVRDEKGKILSAGEDGFLQIWGNRAAEERFQLSPYGIKAMVLHPGKPQISVIESNGLSLYRVSAWNYETKKNLFTLRFMDPVSYINYSAAGSYLIIGRTGRTGLAFVDSETGEVLESPEDFSGSLTLAATGRSERIMICYLSSGIISYWDLDKGNELQHFEVPANLSSPVLFGNNRFLGGFDSRGLIVIDSVTGLTLARNDSIRGGIIFTDSADSSVFNCLVYTGLNAVLYRMEINLNGSLRILNTRNIPSSAGEITCGVFAGDENFFIGTSRGDLWLLARGSERLLETGNPLMISDLAVSSSAIAFITGDRELGFIPSDFSLLENNGVLVMEDSVAYTNITSDPGNTSENSFLLWQNSRLIPVIKTLSGPPLNALTSQSFLDKLSLRFPLRSAAMFGGRILLLDTSGSVFVIDKESGTVLFTYSASGSVDAAFIDQNTIIIGRNAVTGNAPFVTVNISTGETVALPYPALLGARVFRGRSGTIYGAVINQSGANTMAQSETSIIRLDISNPSLSEKLVEYRGEDPSFSMAESGGNLASTLGGIEAALYIRARNTRANTPRTVVPLERSMGFPIKISDGGNRDLVTLDGEGGITWHDNTTGKISAVFRLYSGSWILEKINPRGKEIISGKIINRQS